MTTIDQYLQYAETALAAYADSLTTGAEASNKNSYKRAGMADLEANRFSDSWAVLNQSPNDSNGFSAVLLQNRSTGEKVLAIRGTEPSYWGVDYITDIVDIAALGNVSRMPQYQSLETFYAQLVASGALTSTEQVVVTGHSLGGFLAEAFMARHPGVVSAAYTYNAPGFGGGASRRIRACASRKRQRSRDATSLIAACVLSQSAKGQKPRLAATAMVELLGECMNGCDAHE